MRLAAPAARDVASPNPGVRTIRTAASPACPAQASRCPAARTECLVPEFASLAKRFQPPAPFGDPVRDLQYRDLRYANIPRAMRFADRVSMMYSRELREPFLDHRIVELGLRQPVDRKIKGGKGKWLPRRITDRLVPDGVREAPRRPVQTPQREWLRGPSRDWAEACHRGRAGNLWGRMAEAGCGPAAMAGLLQRPWRQ